ncbi:MAG: hypothetical protein LKJ03_00295 [Enterococcaceae bacterium]|jgi:cell fate (sporulation/competence/biofilm development) regulator YlbF (YheA/YmcA/DUF963 family)|nr:hypothetical protein [Enterococcaceae bacterium]MCI1919335.1 hypothetical protein [Enterococcaceae bacterium]
MLDVIGSIKNLNDTAARHFLHIKNQHDFIRIWAIQFEIAYTDFRVIQMALQLAGKMELLKKFTKRYQAVYEFEYAFAKGGLTGFNQEFGTKIAEYGAAQQKLADVLDEIKRESPPEPENDLL